jgi:asparagine synthase (glutamine-hydrolysing)
MIAGSFEWLSADSLSAPAARPRRYWQFPELLTRCDERLVVAKVREELSESVARQCVADVPLGVFLSGGIDSAALAALAVQNNGPPMTFAVGYEAPNAVDETRYAAETAAALETRHFQTIVDNDWVMLQWYEWLQVADRPSIDGLNTYIVSGAVKDSGVTVALSGLGADELFGGYPSFRRVPRLQDALRTVAWLPRAFRRAAATALLAWLPAGKRSKLVEMIGSNASAIELAALTRRVSSDRTLARLGLNAARLGLSPGFLPPDAYSVFNADGSDPFQAISQAELSLYMGSMLLRDTDINSMAHSLEIRVPFLGQRLVEYVSSLPGNCRAPADSRPKHLLRSAMADKLPQGVFSRVKTGFSLPFTSWIFGPLRDQCEAAIAELAACSLFDAAIVNDMWLEYSRHQSQIHWSRPMSLVVLGSYLMRRKRLATHFNG